MLSNSAYHRELINWSIVSPKGAQFNVAVQLYQLHDKELIEDMYAMLRYLDQAARQYSNSKPAWPETTNGEVPGLENLSSEPGRTVGHIG